MGKISTDDTQAVAAELYPGSKAASSKSLTGLLNDPLAREFGIPILRSIVKKEFGIDTGTKELTKKPAGRFILSLKDFIQGTWWVAVLFTLCMGLSWILLLYVRKVLQV